MGSKGNQKVIRFSESHFHEKEMQTSDKEEGGTEGTKIVKMSDEWKVWQG